MSVLSPLDAQFWGAPGCHICEWTTDGELIADWAALRKCYDFMREHRNDLIGACDGDTAKVGRIIIGAAIWKARNS